MNSCTQKYLQYSGVKKYHLQNYNEWTFSLLQVRGCQDLHPSVRRALVTTFPHPNDHSLSPLGIIHSPIPCQKVRWTGQPTTFTTSVSVLCRALQGAMGDTPSCTDSATSVPQQIWPGLQVLQESDISNIPAVISTQDTQHWGLLVKEVLIEATH